MAIRACYDAAYRFGKPTSLSKIVMDFLGVTDKYYLMEAISDAAVNRKIDYTYLTVSVFSESKKGDEKSTEILEQVGENCARSAGGAAANLDFGEDVEVVLAGSVWVKGASEAMISQFQRKITEFTKKHCHVILLNVPPATGAVIWALELARNQYPDKDMRDKITKNVEKELSRMEGK
jgi:N-acetylglucosamine kinase-like BadF-type ATPase